MFNSWGAFRAISLPSSSLVPASSVMVLLISVISSTVLLVAARISSRMLGATPIVSIRRLKLCSV